MISVAMAFYNGKKYMNEQVESILENIGPNDELVISVDSAQDGSDVILQEFLQNDSRIRIVEGPKQGVVKNFQNAIRHCRGEIIFLSDQDDVWRKNKTETVMKAFADPKVMAVVHNAEITDGHLNALGQTTFEWRSSGPGFWKNMKKNSYIGCCMAFRRNIMKKILPIPEKVWIHDQWIGLLAEQLGRVLFLEDVLLDYRRHEENVTGLKHGSMLSMMKKRYHMLMEINRRVRTWKK